MICPYCLIDIDDDSIFCDQCGKELFVCPSCGKIGKEIFCEIDNVQYVSLNGRKKFSINKFFQTERKLKTEIERTQLILINKNIGIELKLADNDIIGRKSEKFSQLLVNYKQISGKHAKVNFNPKTGWHIMDLNSSNGTKYKGKKIIPFESVKLEADSFLTLANIEFFLLIK